MRIIGSLVVKNEADRYLESCLRWNSQWWDELFVYDDQSTDDTIGVCSTYTDKVVRRPDHISSFLDHEGEFRESAWRAMEGELRPEAGDWIFCFDADEFLVEHAPAEGWNIKARLLDLAAQAVLEGLWSVDIQIPEMWNVDPPMRRMDGFWGDQMYRPEFIRWRPDGKFRNKPMGCGSGPLYSYTSPFPVDRSAEHVEMLHFGHARPEDRKIRHRRYLSLPDHGHSQKHINSIMGSGQLVPWDGVVPPVSFGRQG